MLPISDVIRDSAVQQLVLTSQRGAVGVVEPAGGHALRREASAAGTQQDPASQKTQDQP